MAGFPDFFSLLSVLPAFDIDAQALEKAYFREQRRFHPDRFAGKTDAERIAALQQSADINRAYDTLKDPLKRAQYLLLLQGIFIGTERDTLKPSAALLQEIMELRESVSEADTLKDVYALSDRLDEAEEKLLRDISVAYTKARWDDMAQYALKLGYIRKTRGDVTLRLSSLKKD